MLGLHLLADMITELIRIKIAPTYRERFVQLDHDIWTTAIAQRPGFLRKQIWLNPKDLSDLVIVIDWQTREDQGRALSFKELNTITQQFQAAIDVPYQIIEATLFQVRKSVQSFDVERR